MKTRTRPERVWWDTRFVALAARLGGFTRAAPQLDDAAWTALEELTDLARALRVDLGGGEDRLRRVYLAAASDDPTDARP